MDYGDEKKQEMLPQMLAYNEKPVSPSVLSQRYYVTPNNGNTFTSTSSTGPIIRIDIPGSTPGTHLNPSETALIFTLTNNSGASMALDSSAFGCIQSVSVYYGSTLLSTIDNYDCYCTAMSDFSSSGTHYGRGVADIDIVGTLTGDLIEASLATRNGRTIANGSSDTFVLPLCNILGTLSQKGIALSQINDAIKLEIRLNNQLDIAVYASSPTGTLVFSDVKLWLTNVQINSSVENALMKQLGGIVATPCFDLQNFRSSINAGASSFSYQIPIRTSSLTSVFFCLRETAVFNAFGNRSLSRTSGNLKSYVFRIGSALVPSSPISCAGGAECRLELNRALNAISSAQSDSFVTNALYNAGGATAMAAGAYGARFYGLQLSAFAASELLSDGKSLKAETLVLDLSFNAGGNVPMQLDVFCVFEKVLVIQQGQMTYKI